MGNWACTPHIHTIHTPYDTYTHTCTHTHKHTSGNTCIRITNAHIHPHNVVQFEFAMPYIIYVTDLLSTFKEASSDQFLIAALKKYDKEGHLKRKKCSISNIQ